MAYGTAPGYAPPPYSPPPRDPTDVMGRRVVAYLIDLVIAVAVFVALLAATKDRTYTDIPSNFNNACRFIRAQDGFSGQCLQLGSRAYTWTSGAFALSWGLAALVGLLNNVILQAATGASVGKMVMGLRVVGADGQTAGLGRMFARWLMLIVDAGFCFVGFFVALFTHPRRRLGDMVATTFVVGAADAGTPLQFAPASPPYGQQYGQQYGQPAYVPPPPQQGWGQPQPGGWGQAPPPQQPQWGAPQAQPGWGQPQPQPQPQWGTPPPQQPPAPPPQPQPQWGAPQDAPAPPPASPPAPAAQPDSPTDPTVESWWDNALGGDDEPKQ